MDKPSWVSNASTDIGTVRKVNEDSFFDGAHKTIWCVADGMGGHAKGDVASELITSTLSQLVSRANQDIETNQVIDCLHRVNQQLWSLSQSHKSIVGSTVSLLMFEHQKLHCMWAGDSRIYRVRDRRLIRLTRDHSQVEDMVDAGLISAEEAETHPQANVITRAVGASESIELDHKTYDLLPNDQFLLCSDGLNKVMSDHELEHFLNHDEKPNLCSNLIDIALSRNAKDNVTCIFIYNQSNQQDKLHHTLPLDSTLPLNYSR